MAADTGQQGEKESFRYDRQEENLRLVAAANEFEEGLNGHVDPWIDVVRRMVSLRLWYAIAAFPLAVTIGIYLYERLDGMLWISLGIVTVPAFYLVWALPLQFLTTWRGVGVPGSEGLACTRSEMKAILSEIRTCLESEKMVSVEGLANQRNHSAVRALAKLCGVRMKGLFMHQKVLRRINVLNESCNDLLGQALSTATLIPPVVILCAVFYFMRDFIRINNGVALTEMDGLVVPAMLIVIGLATSFAPFVLAYRFGRKIQRILTETLQEGWPVNPFDFDSTDAMTGQFKNTLDDLEECRRFRQAMKTQYGAFVRSAETGRPALPLPVQKKDGGD